MRPLTVASIKIRVHLKHLRFPIHRRPDLWRPSPAPLRLSRLTASSRQTEPPSYLRRRPPRRATDHRAPRHRPRDKNHRALVQGISPWPSNISAATHPRNSCSVFRRSCRRRRQSLGPFRAGKGGGTFSRSSAARNSPARPPPPRPRQPSTGCKDQVHLAKRRRARAASGLT